MSFFKKITLYTCFVSNFFNLIPQDCRVPISFDRIFPEGQIEKIQKLCINMINQMNDLNLLFDSLIHLHFLLISFFEIHDHTKQILPEDLIFLRNFTANVKNTFENQTLSKSKSAKIDCIYELFNQALIKFEKLIDNNQITKHNQSQFPCHS